MTRIPGMALLLLVALSLGACSKSAEELSAQAKRSHEKGDLAVAVVHLRSAIQMSPADPALRYSLGRVHLDQFDAVAAEKELVKAAELGMTGEGRVSAALARALWLKGDHQGLVERIEPSPKFEPVSQAEIFAYRGQGFAALGKVAEAKQHLENARKIAGTRSMPIVDLLEASVLASSRDVKGALAIIDGVLKKQPKFYDALALKTDIVRLTGSAESAVAAYGDLLEVHPHHLFALIGRSTLLSQLGKFDAAEKDVQTLQAAYKGHFITHFQDGMLRFRKGQFRTALEAFQRTLKINSTYEPAQLYEGMTQLLLGNAVSAQHTLNQYVTARPHDLLGRRMLAVALLQLNESARALELISPQLKVADSPREFWEIAAEAHARVGELDKAAFWLSKLEQAKPDDASVQEKQAALSMHRGQVDNALADYAEAARLAKQPSTADTMLVLLNMRKRDYGAALAAVEALNKKAPGQSFAVNLRGVVLLDQGKAQEARAAFEEALKKEPGFLPAAANLARLDLREGKPDQATKRFEAVLAADKNHLQALLMLSGFEKVQGRANEAMALLERAATAHPAAFEPRLKLVELLLEQGRLQDARARADEAVTRNPNSLAALELLGNVKLLQGDKHSAVSTFGRIVELHPKMPAAYVQRAKAERAAGSLRDAESSLRRALELQKTNVPAQTMLFEILMQQNRLKHATEFAAQLKADFPKSHVGYMLDAEALVFQKKYKEAVPGYRKALDLAEQPDLAIRLYMVRALAGESKEALADLNRWVASRPNHVQPRMLLGDVLMSAGDYAGAMKQFQAALAVAPTNALAASSLAWAYHKSGDAAQAFRFAEGAYKLDPKNPAMSDTLGWMLLQQGKTKEAHELLAKAAGLLRNSPDVRYHYAAALAKLGEKDKARAELRAALDLKQPFSEREQANALLAQLEAK